MRTTDRHEQLCELLVETKVVTSEELSRLLEDSRKAGKPSLWGHLRDLGKISRPQADTLEMAAKGYIPLEAARISIGVQARVSTNSSEWDGRPANRRADPITPRGLLKIQRPPVSSTAPTLAQDPDTEPDEPTGHKEVSTGGFEALLADNIIALPKIRPSHPRPEPAPSSEPKLHGRPRPKEPEPEVPPPPPAPAPVRKERPKADPSSVAVWKQVVDILPRQATPLPPESQTPAPAGTQPPAENKSPRPNSIPSWLSSPGPRSAKEASPPPRGPIREIPSANGRSLAGLVGRRLGKFQISSQIGKGSSGSVYMGHHVVLNMPVAIKVLDPGLAAYHPELLKRFQHEARSAARIAHPNIVRVIDCDHIDGYHIIVMEYMDGISVSELVKINGQVAEERALIIVQAVAEGLEAALECGIIHRDIKPANIMITKNKQVKLADLGLAKRVDDPTNMSDTRPNIGLGTPHYFAPEQASNAVAADHRADIYSLGATLYNMLTGSVPFKGKTIAELVRKHHEEPVIPPHTLVPQLSRATSDLTVYMMAKRPEDRPQNYADLLNAINASIYNLKNRQPRTDAGSKAGSTIVKEILGLFSSRK
jgi:hypothetical protein